MNRPTDWDEVFGLDDPAPGDPWSVRRVATSWGSLADDAEYAESRLRSLMSDEALAGWIGEGGDAFRNKTGDLPDQLKKCKSSYRIASDALGWWAGKLETHQSDADSALVKGRAAKADLESAQSQLETASSSVTGASGSSVLALSQKYIGTPAPANVTMPSSADVQAAQNRLKSAKASQTSASNAVSAAAAQLSVARQLALDAADLRISDGKATATKIHDASDAGIEERSRWDKLKDWVADAWDIIIKICKIVVLVLGVVALILGGPLAWVVFAAAVLILADTMAKYLKGEASLLDVALSALACIPGTKGLTTLSELSTAFKAGGMLGAGGHLLSAGKGALTSMALTLRQGGTWAKEGLTLSGANLRALRNFSAAAARNEPGLTANMESLVSRLPTSELRGLEFRLKGFDSLGRKVATDLRSGDDISVVLGDTKDSIRYTIQSGGDDLAAAANSTVEGLHAQGFENLTFKNSFGADGYQGINSTWLEPSTGQTFEVQFHTPESFEAKMSTHALYEEARLPETAPDRVAELNQMQDEIFSNVPTPDSMGNIATPPRVQTPPYEPHVDLQTPLIPVRAGSYVYTGSDGSNP